MGRNSYSASERRGVLAIAIISLLLVGAGWGVSFCNRNTARTDDFPIVTEHPELIDSISLEQEHQEKKREKKGKKVKESKKREPKTYRERSPLDEPV